MEYPYMKYIYKKPVTEVFKIAEKFKPRVFEQVPFELQRSGNFEKCYKKFIIIREDWEKNFEINSITDLFTEEVRVKCIFKNYDSPLNYWKNNKSEIINYSKNKYGDSDVHSLREVIYEKSKLCNNFKVTLSLSILMIFKPRKWLDISAGWGDRLLSAILYNHISNDFDLYCATDPNKELHPLYQNMIKSLVPIEQQNKFVLIESGFENYKFQNDDFDIVFSSPPFFDLETYSNHEGDSLNNNNTQELWAINFFKPMLINSYNHLKKDGHLILYIDRSKYIEKYLQKFSEITKYKGIIYFYEKKDKRRLTRKIYVWRKIKDDKITDL